jgi:acylphosphatase
VWFRKYTAQRANELGLVGFVKNCRDGTVQGRVQGEAEAVAIMQTWLSETGSPKCSIASAEFAQVVPLPNLSNFRISKP